MCSGLFSGDIGGIGRLEEDWTNSGSSLHVVGKEFMVFVERIGW